MICAAHIAIKNVQHFNETHAGGMANGKWQITQKRKNMSRDGTRGNLLT